MIEAAATKPFGFMPFHPGPGVGGHCIPCDPYYLLAGVAERSCDMPVVAQAMASNDARPGRVVSRVLETLANRDVPARGARIIVVGVAYKPGVQDSRESPAAPVCEGLLAAGCEVSYFDPLVHGFALADGARVPSVEGPRGEDYVVAVAHTLHPGVDYDWMRDCPALIDCTFRLTDVPHRVTL